MQIRGVIFDMDGLLLDTEPVYIACMKKAAGEYGYSVTDEIITACTGVSQLHIDRVLQDNFGPDSPARLINRKHRQYSYEIFQSRGVPLKQGALSLLQEIGSMELPMALATSTIRKVAQALIHKTGLSGYFAAAVFGDQVKRGKPDPDIFLEAAVRLSVMPEECMVFEDSKNGILAAAGAGMRAVLVPDILPIPEEIRKLAYAEYPDLGTAGKNLQELLHI